MRVALIGVGVMGKKYAEMICGGKVKGMELTAIVCRSDATYAWAEGLDCKPTIYRSSDELFSSPDGYDAVIIATPHKTHPELTKRAFELGKAVMCDKPAGVSIGDAIEMTSAAKSFDKLYAVMFHQRLYPKYIKCKELIESGKLGKLSRIMLVNSRYFRTAHYHKSSSWRSSWNGEGGGALINQGQHILDIWQWLFGMPERIYAEIPFGKYNSFLVDDEATVTMRYADNLTAVFMLTTGEAVWEERLEIIGTKGKLLLEDDTLHLYAYSEDSTEYIKSAGDNSRERLAVATEVITFDKAPEPYVPMLENFVAAYEGRAELISEGEAAVNALMLANAAYYSAWTGESVSLPLDAESYEQLLSEHCQSELRSNTH